MGPKILRLSRPWTHISLHMLSSFPFFGMALSATSCVTSSGAVGAEGFGVAAKEGGWHGWVSCAALSEGLVFWWYVPCRALPMQ